MLIDLALIILLVTVITSIVFLIHYIKKFHTNNNNLLKMIANLRVLTDKAEAYITKLEKLQNDVEKIPTLMSEAESHFNELSIITQRAEALSDELESNINSATKIEITNTDSIDVKKDDANQSNEESTTSFLDQSKYFNSLRKIEPHNAL